MLGAILWNTVRGAIEQLEDTIRRYEARKIAAGSREKMSDEIKATALELLARSDIERRLILDKNRLATYADMKAEIELVLESALGPKSAVQRPGAIASLSGPAPTDVDAFTSWITSVVKGSGSKGKGKPKGKNDKGEGQGKPQQAQKGKGAIAGPRAKARTRVRADRRVRKEQKVERL